MKYRDLLDKLRKGKETSIFGEHKPMRLRGGCCTTDSAFEIDQDRKYGEYGKKIRGRNADDNGRRSHHMGGISAQSAGAVAGATSSAGGGGGGGGGGC